jgi:hypothetical protein
MRPLPELQSTALTPPSEGVRPVVRPPPSIERCKVFDMSRRASSFTQADVARALRAAQQVAPGRMTIEIAPDGVIRIVPLDACLVRPPRTEHEGPDDPFACGLESVP